MIKINTCQNSFHTKVKQPEKRKTYTVFSQRLAGILLFRGFVLANIGRDNDGSGKNVFFFYQSEKLQNAIQDYRTHNYTIIKENMTDDNDKKQLRGSEQENDKIRF